MYHDTIEVGTQSPPPKRKVAKLNTSSSCLLGIINECGKQIPVKRTAAHDQGGGGKKRRQHQKGLPAKYGKFVYDSWLISLLKASDADLYRAIQVPARAKGASQEVSSCT